MFLIKSEEAIQQKHVYIYHSGTIFNWYNNLHLQSTATPDYQEYTQKVKWLFFLF